MDHYWESLPGPNWFAGAAIYREQVERVDGPAVFVELGCWKGRSTSFMGVEILNSGKPIVFWAVDHWEGSDEEEHRSDPDVQAGRLHEAFLENIKPVREFVRPLRADTADAASGFHDGSVDFVYVDAAHTRAGVLRDLRAWWPKMKSGGVLAGDDWMLDKPAGEWGIQRAVSDFCKDRLLRFEVSPGSPGDKQYWPQWKIARP